MLLQFMTAVGVLAVLTMVPGPDMAVVTRRAVASGWQDGLRTVGGITAGLLVWGVLAVAGLAAVLAASATAYTVVKLAGAVYLVLLGVQALRQSRRDRAQAPAAAVAPPRGNPWRTGLVSNVLNPKIAVFYTGLLPTLTPAGVPPHTGMALLVLVHTLLTAVWLGGYVLLLSKARAFFEKPAVRQGLDRVTGVVLIGFGLKVATTQP
ncbi:LysE family translocator [Streptomyces capillispiralis]|uniref:Threonine/homoserine/homoserine lactone efflux protein n=1 Tax=Streptomyces capillispiralis TaxID=68182 RepID=A0A561TC19_9ACTN|nr:LysE family translocator [Streptomyces capillispiralis]TWF84646.1 threonine/homoserine/homoserine lactone efflux protein [Streptomyces capillispiralis]GHH95889.1 threonine transporter RhtB [Streptomyces capillispiralis]